MRCGWGGALGSGAAAAGAGWAAQLRYHIDQRDQKFRGRWEVEGGNGDPERASGGFYGKTKLLSTRRYQAREN